jgi:hypothetical protein
MARGGAGRAPAVGVAQRAGGAEGHHARPTQRSRARSSRTRRWKICVRWFSAFSPRSDGKNQGARRASVSLMTGLGQGRLYRPWQPSVGLSSNSGRPLRCGELAIRANSGSANRIRSPRGRDRAARGSVIPGVLAVLRLMINSTSVACCTGRSAGFSLLSPHCCGECRWLRWPWWHNSWMWCCDA